MPTYQYACKTCGHRFEIVQSFSDASLTECPECQGDLRKVFNSVGVVFKGSGFYRNDSRSGSSSSLAGAGSSSGDSGGSADSKGSSETKTSGESGSTGSGSTSSPAAASATSS